MSFVECWVVGDAYHKDEKGHGTGYARRFVVKMREKLEVGYEVREERDEVVKYDLAISIK